MDRKGKFAMSPQGVTMDVTKNMLEVTEDKLLRCLGHVKWMLRNRSPGRILEWEPDGTRGNMKGRHKGRWMGGVRRSTTNHGLKYDDIRVRDKLVLDEGKPTVPWRNPWFNQRIISPVVWAIHQVSASQQSYKPTQKLVSKMHVTTQARITGSNHVLSVVLLCGLKRVFSIRYFHVEDQPNERQVTSTMTNGQAQNGPI